MKSSASAVLIDSPSGFPPWVTNAISNSKSNKREGPNTGGALLIGTRLAGRTTDRRAAHHDARSAAVVSDRHVLPIGQQGVFWIPEHLPDVAGVVFTGIKIGVVAHLNRQVHGRVGLGHQHTRGVIRQFRGAGLQQFPQSVAHRSRGVFAAANEGIERRRFKIRRSQPRSSSKPMADTSVKSKCAHRWPRRGGRCGPPWKRCQTASFEWGSRSRRERGPNWSIQGCSLQTCPQVTEARTVDLPRICPKLAPCPARH